MEVLYIESMTRGRVIFVFMVFSFIAIFWILNLNIMCEGDLPKILVTVLLLVLLVLGIALPIVAHTSIADKVYVRFNESVNIEDFYEQYEIVGKKGEDIYVLNVKK